MMVKAKDKVSFELAIEQTHDAAIGERGQMVLLALQHSLQKEIQRHEDSTPIPCTSQDRDQTTKDHTWLRYVGLLAFYQ